MFLPNIRSAIEFEYLRGRTDLWRAGAQEIARRHVLGGDELRQYEEGSCIVFAVGAAHVIKLHTPWEAEACAREREALAFVHGKLAVPTPALVAAGELDGWPYVLMEQLRGRTWRSVWGELAAQERVRVVRRLGEVAAQLHGLKLDELEQQSDGQLKGQHLLIDWPAFIEERARLCVERQRKFGLPEEWTRRIPSYLEHARPHFPQGFTPSLLHTEFTDVNILLERQDGAGRCDISGLFDFEPSFVGYHMYEFASIPVFISRGGAKLLREFLLGYGYAEEELTPGLRRRLMAYVLLHRYTNLRWFMQMVPPRATTRSLEELEIDWCSFDA